MCLNKLLLKLKRTFKQKTNDKKSYVEAAWPFPKPKGVWEDHPMQKWMDSVKNES